MSARERHPGDRLAALVDGRLAEPDRTRVVEHLTRCTDCMADYDAQLAMKGLLRTLDTPPAPDALRSRLSALAAERGDGDGDGGRPRSRSSRLVRASGVLAGAAVLLLGTGYVLGGTSDGTAVVPPVDQYVREHAAVSVGVPLTAPALYQLVQAPSSLVATSTATTVAPAPAPAPLGQHAARTAPVAAAPAAATPVGAVPAGAARARAHLAVP